MKDDGEVVRGRKLQQFSSCASLLLFRRVIPMVVKADLANSDYLGMSEHLFNLFCRTARIVCRIVWVPSYNGVDVLVYVGQFSGA